MRLSPLTAALALTACAPTDRATPAASVPARAPASAWAFDSTVSPMGDATAYRLSTRATDALPAVLAIQCRRGTALDVLLASDDAATTYALPSVRVRFDNAPPLTADWAVAGSVPSILRARDPGALIRGLATASRLAIEYPTATARQARAFTVAGFGAALPRLRAACGLAGSAASRWHAPPGVSIL